MQRFLENLPMISICLAMFSVILMCVYNIIQMPSAKRKQMLIEWLKLAVVEAEKALGSGTGQLKLRYVYEKAVTQFPWVIKMITFEQFAVYVDEALEWMNKQLESNKAVDRYVHS